MQVVGDYTYGFDLPILAENRSPTRKRGRISERPSLARRASMTTTCENVPLDNGECTKLKTTKFERPEH
jgi:hypothetical protein